MTDNIKRLSDLETTVAALTAWQRSQKVRNRARAATYVGLLIVCAGLVLWSVYLNNYLTNRREVSTQRTDRLTYAACVALSKAPSDEAQRAADILTCDTVLSRPAPPPASPSN